MANLIDRYSHAHYVLIHNGGRIQYFDLPDRSLGSPLNPLSCDDFGTPCWDSPDTGAYLVHMLPLTNQRVISSCTRIVRFCVVPSVPNQITIIAEMEDLSVELFLFLRSLIFHLIL